MSDRAIPHTPAALAVALGQAVSATRFLLTASLLAFGVWAALPTLLGDKATPPTAATVPTALPAVISSALTTIDKALAQAQQSGKAVPLTITLSEADLTRAAAPYFPQTYTGVTVSSPSVRISSGRIVLTAIARSLIGNGQLIANATPYVSGAHLLVRLDSATIGGITVPDFVRSQIQQQLQSAIDAQVPPRLQATSVTAQQGTLTLSGSALP